MMEARVPAWKTRGQYTALLQAKYELTEPSDWKASGLAVRVTQLDNDPQKMDAATCEKLENVNNVTPVTSQTK